MPDVFKVSRGQLWFWDDPTYGKKNARKIHPEDIPYGERALHYSRYVLVLQYPETAMIDGKMPSILVAPLSTSENELSNYDVPVHVYPDGPQSYIKVTRIFSASPTQLTQLVGNVSIDIMYQVDVGIRRTLLDGPFFGSGLVQMDFPYAQISGCDTTVGSEEEAQSVSTESEIYKAARALPHPSVATEEVEAVEEVPEKKPFWDEERIKEFLHIYTIEGKWVAAEKYSLKESTTKTYFNKWIKLYPIQEEVLEEEEVTIPVDELLSNRQALAERIIHLNNTNVRRALNSFSHLMQRYMENSDLYGRLVYDKAFLSKVPKKDFQDTLQKWFFWDIAEKAGITYDREDEKFILPEIDASTDELELLYFLDSLTYERSMLVARTSDVCIERFYKLNKEVRDIRLTEDIALAIYNGILKRFRLTTRGQDIVYKHICGALAL